MAKKTINVLPGRISSRRMSYTGIATIRRLMNGNYSGIPTEQGIFMILNNKRRTLNPSYFLTIQQQNQKYKKMLNVQPQTALRRWIDTSPVLYIGATSNLRARIRKFIKFGMGLTADPCGGWYIWLLKYNKPLFVCWIPLPPKCNPHDVKKLLLQMFVRFYGKRPYANLI